MVSWLIGLMTTFHNVTCLIFQHLFSLNSFLFSVEKDKYFQTRPNQQMTINCKYSIKGQIKDNNLSVSFHVECSSVQISLARCSDCHVWYFPVQSRVVQSGEVKLRLRQSSPVKCSAVQFSLLKCCPAQSSPVHWCAVQSIQWNLRSSSPIPIHSLPAKYISIQRRPGPYKSTAVESSPVNCSAEQCNP